MSHLKLRFFGDQVDPAQTGLLKLTWIPALCCLDPIVFDISDCQLLCNMKQAAINRTGPLPHAYDAWDCAESQRPKAFEPLMVLLLVLSTVVLFDALCICMFSWFLFFCTFGGVFCFTYFLHSFASFVIPHPYCSFLLPHGCWETICARGKKYKCRAALRMTTK